VGYGKRQIEGMAELIELLLKLLLNALKHASEWLERASEWLFNALLWLCDHLPSVAEKVGGWFWELLKKAAKPETLLTFLLAIVLTAFLIGVFLSVHLVINLLRRRRARVFISFQHDRESIADALAAAMASSGVNQVKLPFVERPDHDTLLDQVKQAIRGCDVFVCVPGSRPSFVESEVSMAFGLDKPLLFVVIEADTPRLPNTAKKGYPMFALERVQREGLRTLVNFCSYLAADLRSTVRLYGAALNYWLNHCTGCASAVVGFYLGSIVAVNDVLKQPFGSRGIDVASNLPAWPSLAFIATNMVLFLVPYGYIFISRWNLRAKLRRVISGKKFSESLLPETLDFSLTRANLLKILYCGDIPAEHESNTPAAQNT
jgi:hypothetical protein